PRAQWRALHRVMAVTMQRNATWCLALAVLSSLLSASPALAANAPDEDALIRRGLALRKRGNDEASLPVFQRAYDLSHSARAAAQLGFAEQALGVWPDAERHVSEALRADRDPWIVKNRAVIGLALQTIR